MFRWRAAMGTAMGCVGEATSPRIMGQGNMREGWQATFAFPGGDMNGPWEDQERVLRRAWFGKMHCV